MESLVKNAADPEQVKKAAEKEKRGRERELSDFRSVMSTQQGRRFVARLIEVCGVFKTSMTGNNTTFFNEGQRNIGLIVMTDINEGAADLYETLMKEWKGEKNNG